MMEQEKTSIDRVPTFSFEDEGVGEIAINASGHRQELERNFGFLSTCGFALTAGNTWLALGGGIVSILHMKPEDDVKE